MRCRAVAHLRAVGCRSLAVVAALFTVMAVMFAPQAMAKAAVTAGAPNNQPNNL